LSAHASYDAVAEEGGSVVEVEAVVVTVPLLLVPLPELVVLDDGSVDDVPALVGLVDSPLEVVLLPDEPLVEVAVLVAVQLLDGALVVLLELLVDDVEDVDDVVVADVSGTIAGHAVEPVVAPVVVPAADVLESLGAAGPTFAPPPVLDLVELRTLRLTAPAPEAGSAIPGAVGCAAGVATLPSAAGPTATCGELLALEASADGLIEPPDTRRW
jgi:hypothetical protein